MEKRADDSEHIAIKRFNDYEKNIKPVIDFYKNLDLLKEVNGEASINEINIKINFTTLAMKVIDQLYDGITTTKIDELMAEQCASMSSIRPEFNTLASHLIISNHHKNTKTSFFTVINKLYNLLQ